MVWYKLLILYSSKELLIDIPTKLTKCIIGTERRFMLLWQQHFIITFVENSNSTSIKRLSYRQHIRTCSIQERGRARPPHQLCVFSTQMRPVLDVWMLELSLSLLRISSRLNVPSGRLATVVIWIPPSCKYDLFVRKLHCLDTGFGFYWFNMTSCSSYLWSLIAFVWIVSCIWVFKNQMESYLSDAWLFPQQHVTLVPNNDFTSSAITVCHRWNN